MTQIPNAKIIYQQYVVTTDSVLKMGNPKKIKFRKRNKRVAIKKKNGSQNQMRHCKMQVSFHVFTCINGRSAIRSNFVAKFSEK